MWNAFINVVVCGKCGKQVTFNYLPALEEVDSDSVLKPEIWCEHSFTHLERVVFVILK